MLSGDADAEVKRLLGESAELNSAQQEAEAQLGQSRQIIQELQAALKSAQVLYLVFMFTCMLGCKKVCPGNLHITGSA